MGGRPVRRDHARGVPASRPLALRARGVRLLSDTTVRHRCDERTLQPQREAGTVPDRPAGDAATPLPLVRRGGAGVAGRSPSRRPSPSPSPQPRYGVEDSEWLVAKLDKQKLLDALVPVRTEPLPLPQPQAPRRRRTSSRRRRRAARARILPTTGAYLIGCTSFAERPRPPKNTSATVCFERGKLSVGSSVHTAPESPALLLAQTRAYGRTAEHRTWTSGGRALHSSCSSPSQVRSGASPTLM